MSDLPSVSRTDDLRLVGPSCCGRPMSKVAVTDEDSELAMLSCSTCSRHAWLRDGQLLDREGMLAAVKERLAHAPRPKGGRPRGSGSKQRAAAAATPKAAPAREDQEAARRRRVEEMRVMLSGFSVLGETDRRA